MKILILSDMHSNPCALRAIMQAEGRADNIYFAGDFVDYGPDALGAVALAREYGLLGVSGNHDRRLLRVYDSGEYLGTNTTGRIDSVYGALDQSQPNIRWVDLNCKAIEASPEGRDTLEFLRSLPAVRCFTADGIAYLMSHQYDGGYGTIQTAYHFDKFWDEHFDLPGCEGMPRRMIVGHTHRQLLVRLSNDALWMNPGSISYRRPDDPSKDAFYICVTDGEIEMKHVPYDRSGLYSEVVRSKPLLHPDEARVAEFFFGWDENDGPDNKWLAHLARIVR